MIKTQVHQEILAANSIYAANFGDKGKSPLPPARRFAVLTCMDARLEPAKYAGLADGDAHVIRNAGGRASDDAIRSIVISHKLLGMREFFVIHHTDCGMVLSNSETMGDLLSKSLDTAVVDGNGWHDASQGPGSEEGRRIDRLTFTDESRAVLDDVKKNPQPPACAK